MTIDARSEDRDLEEALSALVESMPQPEAASVTDLAQWTPQARPSGFVEHEVSKHLNPKPHLY